MVKTFPYSANFMSMRTRLINVANFYLIFAITGCTTTTISSSLPEMQYTSSDLVVSDTLGSKLMDDFKPNEGIVLIDGEEVDATVTLKVNTTSNLELYLIVDNRLQSPFKLSTSAPELGDSSFNMKVAWPVTPEGDSERIEFALYNVEHSDSGRTISRVLLQHHQTDFKVHCNQTEFFLTLFFKKLFNYCVQE